MCRSVWEGVCERRSVFGKQCISEGVQINKKVPKGRVSMYGKEQTWKRTSLPKEPTMGRCVYGRKHGVERRLSCLLYVRNRV